ncbi:hypothetical protein FIBSPDRAFT_545803 [Athelia psychrophila]|uniref:Uncharacterized protein n=1 Tax=Athelia psychrophila TaxID=1759441 RepID=A0A167TEW6_9AGAM|nr:hypothetical protein FIBSPDRAFT_545803 [Fibularhizoctonia sp. CBS 109695]
MGDLACIVVCYLCHDGACAAWDSEYQCMLATIYKLEYHLLDVQCVSNGRQPIPGGERECLQAAKGMLGELGSAVMSQGGAEYKSLQCC